MKQLITVLLLIVPCMLNSQPVTYVDPHIGTFGGGETLIGACVPWGMVTVNPHTQQTPSGHYSFHGFGHVHISGAGCRTLGHIVLMPGVGTLHTEPVDYQYFYKLWNVSATPGRLTVYLDEEDIAVDMTATQRAGISRYRFPARDDDATILIDVSAGYSSGKGSHVEFLSPTEVRGWHSSEGLCSGTERARRTVYFHAVVSKTPTSYGTWSDSIPTTTTVQSGEDIGAYLKFATDGTEEIVVKVGISYVSMDNARLNLDTEIPHWDFEDIYNSARESWNTQLGKISVHGTEENKRTFYTALYHSLLHPNVYSDVNGDYPSMKDYSTLKAGDYTRYTVYSLWDTFRTLHPLLTLVYPEQQLDMVRSLTAHYRESGWLSQWEMPGGETNGMLGDPAGLVLLDTYAKGLTDFDITAAFEGAKKNATVHNPENTAVRRGFDVYLEHGYIPMDKRGTPWAMAPVTSTLEYAYSDWAASQLALLLCDPTSWSQLYRQSKNYRHVFTTDLRCFRPRNADGSWHSPFTPEMEEGGDFPGSGGPGFAEGHSWHYLFYVLHDLRELSTLLGGDTSMLHTLQEFFDKGYYRWNEHNMANPYLFTGFDGEGHRTQRLVRQLAKSFHNGNTGIPGNDDLGALSSWYVFTAMGFYPVQPGIPEYRLGSPLFDSVTIALDNRYYSGDTFRIIALNNADDRPYIDNMQLNSSPYFWYTLQHDDITSGGDLVLSMAPMPGDGSYTATPTPQPLAPEQDQYILSTSVKLRWQPRLRATGTHLLVYGGNDCMLLLDTLLDGRDTAFVLANLEPSTYYSWKVRHLFDSYTSGWSQPRQFLTASVLGSHPETVQHGPVLEALPSMSDGEPFVFRYTLPESTVVQLTIVDMLGRQRVSLREGFTPAGEHVQSWTPFPGESGWFLLRLQTDRTVVQQQLLVVP